MHTLPSFRSGSSAAAPRWKRSTLRLAAAALLFPALFPLPAPPATAAEPLQWSMQAGGGVYVPFEDGHDKVYGSNPMLELAASARLPGTKTWVGLEADWWNASGYEYGYDYVYQRVREKYWALPVTMVVRANALKGADDGPVALYLGFGLTTLFTRFTSPDGISSSRTGYGVQVEMRPEIRLSDNLNLYVRQRLALMNELNYERDLASLGFEGMFLSAGLSRRFR